MKDALALVILLSIAFYSNGQSKKELEEQITQLSSKLNEQAIELQTEREMLVAVQKKSQEVEANVAAMQLSNASLTSTITIMNSTIQELNKQITSQAALLSAMSKQIDSLKTMRSVAPGSTEMSASTIPMTEDDPIYTTIQKYFACKRWEDRLVFVLAPERVKGLMKEAYASEYEQSNIDFNKMNIQGSGFKVNEHIEVMVRGDKVHLLKTNNGYFIDWEATYGYNAISLQEHIDQNKASFSMRCQIMLVDNGAFNDKYPDSKYHRYFLADSNGGSFNGVIYYGLKTSEADQQIFKIAKDGQWHPVTATFDQDFNDTDDYNKVYVIKKMNSSSWYY
ncbi:MAG: hypothetical protein ACKOZY_11895 [Flavobacteriales bacterium]